MHNELHDAEIHLSSFPTERRRSASAMAAVLLVFVLLLAAGAVAYWWMHRTAPAAPQPAAPTAPTTAPSAAAPAESAPVNLPPLEASDDFVRQQLSALSGGELQSWLATDGLARRFAATVYAVANGKSPHRIFDRPAVSGRFAVVTDGDRAHIDPASYARYDGIAATVAGLDPAKTAAAFKLLHPLLVAAWSEVGAPGETIDAALARAIDQLLAVPDVSADAAVILEDGLYKYADPALESLTPAQKHLLRMGPDNVAKVKNTLRQLRTAALS